MLELLQSEGHIPRTPSPSPEPEDIDDDIAQMTPAEMRKRLMEIRVGSNSHRVYRTWLTMKKEAEMLDQEWDEFEEPLSPDSEERAGKAKILLRGSSVPPGRDSENAILLV